MMPKTFPITSHTRHVGPGSTFVAIKGSATDGRQFIAQAVEKGATTIVVDDAEGVCVPGDVELIVVDDVRIDLAKRCAQAYDFPGDKLTIIGITGTSGKTTTAYLLHHLLTHAGIPTALITGIEHVLGDDKTTSHMTTPPADYLQAFFNACVQRGVTHAVMEISSHALAYYRVDAVPLSYLGFLNLSPEHLDFHRTMDDYFAAKMRALELVKSDGGVVVVRNDEWGDKARMHAQTLSKRLLSPFTDFVQPATLPGTFNQENISCAIAIAHDAGVDHGVIARALSTFPGVLGRMQEHVLKNGARAFVDYAHKSDALEKVLSNLREQTDDLIVVFGCGGEKDVTKRPVMGELAARYADHIILTNDNPRGEDPDEIIDAIVAGVPAERLSCVCIEKDRAAAINRAARIAQKGSVIALLGKGHETTIDVAGEMSVCSDFEEIGRY